MIFCKESKSEKKTFFGGGESKGGLASISAFVLQRFQIKTKIEGGGGRGEVRGLECFFK